MKNFPHSRATNQNAVHEQRNPDEKPDRNAAFVMRSHRLIAPNTDSTLERVTKFAPTLHRNMAQAPEFEALFYQNRMFKITKIIPTIPAQNTGFS